MHNNAQFQKFDIFAEFYTNLGQSVNLGKTVHFGASKMNLNEISIIFLDFTSFRDPDC